MNTLDDVIPREELAQIFGNSLTFREFAKEDMQQILKRKPDAVHAVGGNVWNRIVNKQWAKVDPMQLAPYFNRQDPKLYAAISKIVNEDVIRDIRYVQAWNGVPRKANLVMELLLVDVYKSDLHLGDITFLNPSKPIAPINRKFTHQTHEGLGLMGTLIGKMERYAVQKGYEQLTLTAADADLVPLFTKHGFRIEESDAAKIALQFGVSIPMEKDVAS